MVGFEAEREAIFFGRLRHLKTPNWLEKLFRKSRYMWLLCTSVYACVWQKHKGNKKKQNLQI